MSVLGLLERRCDLYTERERRVWSLANYILGWAPGVKSILRLHTSDISSNIKWISERRVRERGWGQLIFFFTHVNLT